MQHGTEIDVDEKVDVPLLRLEKLLRPSTPALLTRMSNSTSPVSFASAARSVTSMVWGIQPVRSASAWSASALRATACTWRFSRRSRSTTAAPMPEDAPVTSAVL
jgi:hypothetical protein